jgi:hypothetical protein
MRRRLHRIVAKPYRNRLLLLGWIQWRRRDVKNEESTSVGRINFDCGCVERSGERWGGLRELIEAAMARRRRCGEDGRSVFVALPCLQDSEMYKMAERSLYAAWMQGGGGDERRMVRAAAAAEAGVWGQGIPQAQGSDRALARM